MNKHTPGPWNHNGLGGIYKGKIFACGQSLIATVAHDEWITEETSRINARLIAAAPEMKEVLKEIRQQYWDSKYNEARCWNETHEGAIAYANKHEMVTKINAILSKIEA